MEVTPCACFILLNYRNNTVIFVKINVETHVWANQTRNNSIIFYDNDFEVFVDTDGSNVFYKELEMNASAS